MFTTNQKIEYPSFSSAPTVEIAENNGSQTALERARALLHWLIECQKGAMTVSCCKTLTVNLRKFLDECENVLSPIPQLKHKLEEFLEFLKAESKSNDQIFVDDGKILPIIQELDQVIKATNQDHNINKGL